MEFRGYQSTYVASLPPVADVPLFQKYDSLYRLLAKACAPDPADRFASADELRVQLLGVLREVVAMRPDAMGAAALGLVAAVQGADRDRRGPGLAGPAGAAVRREATRRRTGCAPSTWRTRSLRLELLVDAPKSSPEVLLATGRTALDAGQPDLLDTAVSDLLAEDPWEWRAVWLSGLSALAAGNAKTAQAAFNAVYGQVPGELAPKLALALACEHSGELDVAEALYTTCARTDANYIAPAAFGLARIRNGRGDTAGAVAALDLVPRTSGSYTTARRQRAGILIASGGGLPALAEAMRSVETLTIDPVDRAQLSIDVYGEALKQVILDGSQENLQIGGRPATEDPLRGRSRGGVPGAGRIHPRPRGTDPPHRSGERGTTWTFR